MKSYGQFCPVAQAAEVVTERWTPLVLRELLLGSKRFGDLKRGIPTMSPSLLSARLKQLEDAGIVRREATGASAEYHLTEAGLELRPVIEQLGVWGERWTRKLTPETLDAGLLMWDLRRRIDLSLVPNRRVVLSFELRGAPSGQRDWWLVIEKGGVDLCLFPPGHPVDVTLKSDLLTMAQVWMGDIRWADALRSKKLVLEGDRALVAAIPKWLLRSAFADVPRAKAAVPGVPVKHGCSPRPT